MTDLAPSDNAILAINAGELDYSLVLGFELSWNVSKHSYNLNITVRDGEGSKQRRYFFGAVSGLNLSSFGHGLHQLAMPRISVSGDQWDRSKFKLYDLETDDVWFRFNSISLIE